LDKKQFSPKICLLVEMDPLIFVIFGASGDLARRKLIPAIYQLHKTGHLPDCFAVLGVSRTEYDDEEFRRAIFSDNPHLKKTFADEGQDTAFARKLFYLAIDTNTRADYAKVKEKLRLLDERCHTKGNYLFYLSTPPQLYELIPEFLAHHGLNNQNSGWKRLIIEKPFGHDEASARALNEKLQSFFGEDQLFRIDHYLGIFEPLWNRNYVQHVEITSAEDIGVENRGGYYDESGALRDMVQNHLLQVLAHAAMEPPINADAKSIRNEKVKLFQSLRPISEKEVARHVVRGQYIAARVNGEALSGYRDEKGVPEESRTETYVALRCFIDNWRWAGVPFFIRTGKRLPTKVTELSVTFKSPPHHLFLNERGLRDEINRLVVRVQPDEGLALQFGMKVPGAGFQVKDVLMDFHYSDLTESYVPEAYERLLMDCIKGDATLYARGDAVEVAWQYVDPILKAWQNDERIPLYGYPAGSWGPPEANALFEGLPNTWRNPCPQLTSDKSFCQL
jgi:glucose-6-phosphate 1-dehydrogenase